MMNACNITGNTLIIGILFSVISYATRENGRKTWRDKQIDLDVHGSHMVAPITAGCY